MKNKKFYKVKKFGKKVVLISLSAIIVSRVSVACHNKKLKNDVKDEISSLKSEITVLKKQNNELINARSKLQSQANQSVPTPEPTSKPVVVYDNIPQQSNARTVCFGQQIATEDSIMRSMQIQNSIDPIAEMYTVYDYVGDEFVSKNGCRYRKVSVIDDDNYKYGYFNMNTFTEDIPCKKYDYIGHEFKLNNGNVYCEISVPNDNDYAHGFLNMNTLTEDIPCMTYDYIGTEYVTKNGNVYFQVSIPNDKGYAHGFLNMNTLTEDIPSMTYKKIDSIDNDIYKCTKHDGSVYTYDLGKKY